MEKLSMEDLLDLVDALDKALKERGLHRENRIELTYRYKKYVVSLRIEDDEDEDE